MLIDKVEKVLNLYPDTRKSDIKLCARILEKFYEYDYDEVVNILAEVNPNSVSRAKRALLERERERLSC